MSKHFLIASSLAVGAALFVPGNLCGRNAAPRPAAEADRKVLYYVDPMNPAHTSHRPGVAPCGMKMEPVFANDDPGTGISYLGEGRMLATRDVPQVAALAAYEIIEVPDAERYAANALRVNDRVLVAAGYPQTRAAIESLGFEVVALDMSEFRKLDGGLSCLSLRW